MGLDLLAVARRQHGLFTTQQALDAGFSRTQLRTRVTRGQWTTIARGVHHIAGIPYTWRTRVMTACLATGGVASHRTAAVLHGVLNARPGRPEVTVVRHANVRSEVARIHRSTDLVPAHITTIDGLPTTTPVRLAMDLGAVVPFAVYERAVDDLVARRALSWDEIVDALGAVGRRGRNGVGAARELVAERYGDDVPESVLEQMFLALIRGADLPEPAQQVDISDDAGGFIARVDFAYPDRKLIIELDGRRFHLNAAAFEADRVKRNRLQLAGWTVLAYTWEHLIRSGATIVHQVSRYLTP